STDVAVSDACLEAFQDLKLKHNYKFIIYKISDDNKEIVVETTSDDGDYEQFLKCFPEDSCRYAICDFQYENEGNQNKILFYT
ncbi:cofilin, partial [Dissophora ornata]